ncbi:hypothetical protein ABW20_dc0109955 [Dactylellina cionopaga]|nr:hypothetical protein ABW20_dc0109955 [Dactylellina cionopaga]
MPPRRTPARKIPAWEWNRQRDNFILLYVEENLKLHECMELMERRHKFAATRRQYLQKIQEWGVEKKVKPAEMKVAVRKVLERWVGEGKDTCIQVRDVVISRDKMKRFLRREEDRMQKFLLTPVPLDTETPISLAQKLSQPVGNDSIRITGGIYGSSMRAQQTLIRSPKYLITGLQSDKLNQLRKSIVTSQETLIDDSRVLTHPSNPQQMAFELPSWWKIRKLGTYGANCISADPCDSQLLRLMHTAFLLPRKAQGDYSVRHSVPLQ